MIGKIHWNVKSIIKHLVFRVHSFKLFWKTQRMRLIFFWIVAGIEPLRGILRSWGFRKVFTIMTYIFFKVRELKYCKRNNGLKLLSASSLCLLSNFVISSKVVKPKAIPVKDCYFWLISCSAIHKATIGWLGRGLTDCLLPSPRSEVVALGFLQCSVPADFRSSKYFFAEAGKGCV